MKKRKKNNNGILVFLLILIIGLCMVYGSYYTYHKYFKNPVDPNVIKDKDNDEEKLDKSQNGGAASLEYSNQMVVYKDKKIVNMYFKNPNKSREKMKLEAYLIYNNKEELIAKSDMIPVGYLIENLDYIGKNDIKQGNYKGKLIVSFFDEESDKEQIVNSKIDIEITVK